MGALMPRSERLRRTRVALVAGSLLLIGFAAGGSIWFAARTIDWDRLSNVGQAFGTISAALSAVALVGVAVAIYIQVQQTTISREYAVRSMRVDLVRFAIEHPEHLAAWGFAGLDREHARGSAYHSMVFGYLKMSFMLVKTFTELELRHTCEHIFKSPAALRWWAESRAIYLQSEPRFRGRGFVQIVDEVYGTQRVAAMEPAEGLAGEDANRQLHGSDRAEGEPRPSRFAVAVTAGRATGLCSGLLPRCRSRRDPR